MIGWWRQRRWGRQVVRRWRHLPGVYPVLIFILIGLTVRVVGAVS